MIVRNSGGKFELRLEKRAAFDSTPILHIHPPTEKVRSSDSDAHKPKIVEQPVAAAVDFLTQFSEAAASGVVVTRLTDIELQIKAGKHSIYLRSQSKPEAAGLVYLETLPVVGKIEKLKNHQTGKGFDALTIRVKMPEPVIGESEKAQTMIVGAAPKQYEELDDADLATECTTRGIDPYLRNRGGDALKSQIKTRSALIKALRSHDADKAKV